MMMFRLNMALAAPILAALAGSPAPAGGGRVDNLKVLSDQVDDVSTIEQVVKTFARPGMSDPQRAEALWRAAVKYRHQQIPANEYLDGDEHPHDPVKVFNVYGYCQCCCASAILEALNREDGREARGRILNGHSVPETRYGGGWHLFDASLITYFPRPEDGVVASVDEVAASVADWYATHPGYRGDGAKLLDLMRRDGWMGWKADGPRLLANCPFYKAGYLPARTHGWDATMVEYDRKPEVYEYGYQAGHRALFSLRPGETFEREAGNRGLHVNGDPTLDRLGNPTWDGLRARVPENDLAYVPEFVPGYRGGIVGNGKHIYAPDLEAGELEQGAETFENLASGPDGVTVKDRSKPGVVVFEMKSPYVYLGGVMNFVWNMPAPTLGSIAVSISTDGGRSFVPTGIEGSSTTIVAGNTLGRWIARRYAYRVKIEMTGTARLTYVGFSNDIQHAPRTLPRLAKGKTTITVAAGLDPTVATKTIAGRIAAPPDFAKNERAEALGVTFANLKLEYNACWWQGGPGVMTVPIDVPGDLVGLGFSAMIRARGEKDRVVAKVSTDAGQTWREVAVLAGPTQGRTHHVRVDDWPAGVRKALLRFELTGDNTVGIQSFRVDADHRDPLASPTFRPFHVVHNWKEGDAERSHDETITKLPTTYVIEASGDPEMVSVSYRMPPGR